MTRDRTNLDRLDAIMRHEEVYEPPMVPVTPWEIICRLAFEAACVLSLAFAGICVMALIAGPTEMEAQR